MEKPLSDKEIEAKLLEFYSIDDPENSEDENEDEDDYFGNVPSLQSILEGTEDLLDTNPIQPSTSATEDNVPSQRLEHSNLQEYNHDNDDDDVVLPRSSYNQRRRPRVVYSSESEHSDDSDEDELDWKKVKWSTDRPEPESFDDIKIQPAVFFPSRTSPAAYFTRFFDNDVIELITEQTNLYAAEKRSKNWEPVTTTDIKTFIGMLILMGIHDLPSIDLYWSSDPFFRVEEVAQIMTCKRFKKIMENLHLNDNTLMLPREDRNYDKLHKVRPLIDMINVACQREAKCTTSQSIDEAMIKFKGISSLKQYMPLKPVKRGFKVWVRADSASGYVYEFQIYTGKNDNNSPELGLGENVVKSLTKTLIDQQVQAHVAFDNFFSSYQLMQYLYEHGIHSTGTVNPNRTGLPKLIKDKEKSKANRKELDRGQYKWRVKNDVAFILWKDKKPVTILTTAFHPTEVTACNRTMKDGTKKEIPCPVAVTQYTKRMGGVDRFDQKRGTYEVARRSKKWWRRIFYFLIDLCITNAYNLYQNSLRVPNPLSNLMFRLALARGLIGNHTSRKRKLDSLPNYAMKKTTVTPTNNYQKVVGVPDEIRYLNVGIHMPHEMSSYRRCRLCSTKVANKRTKIMCNHCLVPLCVFPYFSVFHAK